MYIHILHLCGRNPVLFRSEERVEGGSESESVGERHISGG